MICQLQKIINSIHTEKWQISLGNLYDMYTRAVRMRRTSFDIAESGKLLTNKDYILYGTYARKTIYDVQQVQDSNGAWIYKEVFVQELHIQRIQECASKKTHALLLDILVPYGSYSVRFILYHLSRYFNQHKSIEKYCSGQRFDERTFKGWLTWLRQNITLLADLGLTRNVKENRAILKQWVEEIMEDFIRLETKSLRVLKHGLFQRHKMPNHSARQRQNPSG